jgi:hypothetical protein
VPRTRADFGVADAPKALVNDIMDEADDTRLHHAMGGVADDEVAVAIADAIGRTAIAYCSLCCVTGPKNFSTDHHPLYDTKEARK